MRGRRTARHDAASYGSEAFRAVIAIQNLAILEGELPPKAVGLVMEWARMHGADLMKSWDLARTRQPLFKIEPLE
ncbi:MAG: DUF4160 domain-containing protein [Candidatus Eisenbacteria bacterium]|nr:DUF4160 domain-containing protein [Candidatus Eisenbacteria bacterium]